jgi:rRNA maturation RNase YbeY
VLRAEKVRGALVSVAFVSDRAIAGMNEKHLRHKGPTDVISFGFDRPTTRDPVVGDIYIAPAVASRNAKSARRPVREELVRLLVHGTLHVLGYEHPEDEKRESSAMWRRQERLVSRLAGVSAR